MSKSPDITCERAGRCGLVTINRPKALNAVSYDMISKMEEAYIEWAGEPEVYGIVLQSADPRAFCSGGDIKALYEWKTAGQIDKILELYTIEYQHNWTLDRFIKPHVSLINGYVFGGGVGISQYGTHKVGGENYRFAMPEAGIGFFPDVGAASFLTRLPGQFGLYLGLTGTHLDRADCYALGLLTHCIDSKEYPAILEAMQEADPIDPVLDERHFDPGPSSLLDMQDTIDRHFSLASVEDILQSLADAPGGEKEWAEKTRQKILSAAPFSLKVVFHQLRNIGQPSLEEALTLDALLAHALLTRNDLYEGVRALLVDKDSKPQWSPSSLEHVDDDAVAACFAPCEDVDFKPINPFS